jgi:hypothetical protein
MTLEEPTMPEKATKERAQRAKRQGKSASTQAGEFVREEMHHIREGKHGAKSAKQAIAIGLNKARREGVPLKAKGKSASAAKPAGKSTRRASPKRAAAAKRALKAAPGRAASHRALSRQAHSAAKSRSRASRSASAKKAARTRARTSASR